VEIFTQAPQKIFQNISFWIIKSVSEPYRHHGDASSSQSLNRLSHIDLQSIVFAIAIRTLEDVRLDAALDVVHVTWGLRRVLESETRDEYFEDWDGAADYGDFDFKFELESYVDAGYWLGIR